MNNIKNILMYFLTLKKLYIKNRKRKFPLNFRLKWFAWKNGFLPESYVIYNFDKNSPKDYLSDFDRAYRAPRINDVNSLIIDNKLLFASIFKDKKAVKPLFYIKDKKIVKIDNNKVLTIQQFVDLLKNSKEYVFKPEDGGGGYGINFVKYEKSAWIVNEEKKSENYIFDLVNKLNNTLIYDKIYQTGFASKIFPSSLNTIRVLTMIDYESKKAFIASAVFRCGTHNTFGVDNWSSGGLSSNVDIDSGKLSKAVTFPFKGKLDWVYKHPDTNFEIENFVIPNWENIKKELLDISQNVFYIPYIGWDVIPMENDFLLLEANSNTDVNLLQVHKPLLKDPKVLEFYKNYKVI